MVSGPDERELLHEDLEIKKVKREVLWAGQGAGLARRLLYSWLLRKTSLGRASSRFRPRYPRKDENAVGEQNEFLMSYQRLFGGHGVSGAGADQIHRRFHPLVEVVWPAGLMVTSASPPNAAGRFMYF